jgi:hypothetical protein
MLSLFISMCKFLSYLKYDNIPVAYIYIYIYIYMFAYICCIMVI